MTQLDTLKSKLETAREEQEALKADLPRFHSLLTDNEQEAERLRRKRAPLDDQAQAKGRVNVAREMLQQHQSDIQAAQGEVATLEGKVRRELILLELAEHSQVAKAERGKIDAAFLRLCRELERAASTIGKAWDAENQARRAFAEKGGTVLPGLQNISAYFTSDEPEKKRRTAFLNAIREHGGQVDAIKDGATGSFTFLDAYAVRALPDDAVSIALWEAVRRVSEEKPIARTLDRYIPKRANPNSHFPTVLEAGGVVHG